MVVVGAGLVLAGLAWTQHPELRPALTPALLLLAVAVVPGAARSAALLLVLPFLAVIFAVLAEPVAARPCRSAGGPAAAALPLTALALALVVGLLAVVNARPAPPGQPGRLGRAASWARRGASARTRWTGPSCRRGRPRRTPARPGRAGAARASW